MGITERSVRALQIAQQGHASSVDTAQKAFML